MSAALARSTLLVASLAAPVIIPTVPVGNPGNAGEVQSRGTFGAVGYDYLIATTEVTNAQDAAFLSDMAKSDPLGLYNLEMDISLRVGITQIGSSPNFSYAPKTNMAEYVVDLN